MAFMLVALFFFFTLVGLFVINIALKDVSKQADTLSSKAALSALRTIANMPEFSCSSSKEFCLDEDKLRVMSGASSESYAQFWPVASIQVYLLEHQRPEVVTCPAANCNHFKIYDSGQVSKQEVATFVSVCKQVRELNYVREDCQIGKLVVGSIIHE